MAKYLCVQLTKKQIRAADAALLNLIANKTQLEEMANVMDQTYIWEKEALFRLRHALLSAINSEVGE